MKNIKKKNQKGITLIALIITIIILLILAIVTISAVNEGSLFAHANNAASAYDKAAQEENTIISGYLAELEKHNNGSDQEETGEISLAITDEHTYPKVNGILSTTYEETITATLAEGLDASNLTWSTNSEHVTISGSGLSVTVTGVSDGSATITASYNGGEYTKSISITVQNKWAQRGVTNVQLGKFYRGSGILEGKWVRYNLDGSYEDNVEDDTIILSSEFEEGMETGLVRLENNKFYARDNVEDEFILQSELNGNTLTIYSDNYSSEFVVEE